MDNEEYILAISFDKKEDAERFMNKWNNRPASTGNCFSTALYVRNYYPFFYYIDVIEIVILKIKNFWKEIRK
jgi:hypothetical protein